MPDWIGFNQFYIGWWCLIIFMCAICSKLNKFLRNTFKEGWNSKIQVGSVVTKFVNNSFFLCVMLNWTPDYLVDPILTELFMNNSQILQNFSEFYELSTNFFRIFSQTFFSGFFFLLLPCRTEISNPDPLK